MCGQVVHKAALSTIACLSVGLLPACGGGDVATRPSLPVLVAEGSFAIGVVQSGNVCDVVELVEFATNQTGTIQAVVDWTLDRNNLDVALIRGRCTCQDILDAPSIEVLAQVCPVIAESLSETAKPEQVGVGAQQAGTYTLIVLNSSDAPESGSYQVILTPFS